MGCDIHVRCEYLARDETVVVENGSVVVAPEGALSWLPAERLAPNEYVTKWREQLTLPRDQRIGQPDDAQLQEWIDETIKDEGEVCLNYDDRFYTGRNYRLFTLLAGVRGDASDAKWDDRGFPADASPEVTQEFESWGYDAHTPSYQTLDELLQVDWEAEMNAQGWGWRNASWLECLEKMKDVAVDKTDGDHTRVRLVYYFDN